MSEFDSFEEAALAVGSLTVVEDGVTLTGHEGTEVTLGALFPAPFVARHTDSPSLAAFLEASPVGEGNASAEADDFDSYVATHSEFGSWEEMAAAAKAAWLERELGLL